MNVRLAWMILTILGIMPGLSKANALYPVSLPEKVKNATVIAEGVVESQYCFWNPSHTMIFTANRVKVSKLFYGDAPSGYLQVLTQGGTVDNMNIQASDLLELQAGEAGTFFCFPNGIDLREPAGGELLMDVYSSSQGFYKYNPVNYSANAPFDSYVSITRNFYAAITTLTGRAIVNLQPSVSYDPPAPTVAQQGVTGFTPLVVNAGAILDPANNVLTILGSGFGAPGGSAAVMFPDADKGGGNNLITIAYNNPLIVSWTDTEIKIKVPAKAGSGVFKVVNSSNVTFPASPELKINYSVLTASFNNGANILQISLINANGYGGYSVAYSTPTLGGGRNLNTAPEKAPIQRAINTWKEICGANILENGNSTTQQINSNDGFNILVLDNTNTTVPVLGAGVLASTYSYAAACLSGNTYPAFKTGFDVLIRNSGVSSGTTNFTLGPCPPATNITQLDFETVILHELGHALSLGHIVDSYQGNQLPYVNPPKLMNYAIPNGVKRVTPDYSAKTGAEYNVSQKGLNFGNCIDNGEMIAIAKTVETKDECPVNFPSAVTPNNTQVSFDLVHATSNINVDPQFDALTCNGNGTGVTNTAYYAIKTNNSGGALSLSVSGFSTQTVAQQQCTVAGVQLALYKANGCPVGQQYPDPVACRTFNADGSLSDITGLQANANYLIMVNGLSNTKANFTLNINGTAILPVKLLTFTGVPSGDDNLVHWEFDNLTDLFDVALQRSEDGTHFSSIEYWSQETYESRTNYIDKLPPATSYYRVVFTTKGGVVNYSNVLRINHKVDVSWKAYPNPARGSIHLYTQNVTPGRYSSQLYNSSGMLVKTSDHLFKGAGDNYTLQVQQLPAGIYQLVVKDWVGNPVYHTTVNLMP